MSADDELLGTSIFIDLPNLLQGAAHAHHGMSWRLLCEAIIREVDERRFISAAAYAQNQASAQVASGWIERMMTTLGLNGFDVMERYGKDIDAWIMSDVWKSVVHMEHRVAMAQEAYAVPMRMRHVLVSGDGGYLRTYRDIKRVYGDDLSLELIVFSWRSSLSDVLQRYADKVLYLDDIPRLIQMPTPASDVA
jgi:hypothetical protein